MDEKWIKKAIEESSTERIDAILGCSGECIRDEAISLLATGLALGYHPLLTVAGGISRGIELGIYAERARQESEQLEAMMGREVAR